MMADSRKCNKCQEVKTLDNFYLIKGVKPRSFCKPCTNASTVNRLMQRYHSGDGYRELLLSAAKEKRDQKKALLPPKPPAHNGVSKVCTGCKQDKVFDDFHKGAGIAGRFSQCKVCRNTKMRAYMKDRYHNDDDFRRKTNARSWAMQKTERAKERRKEYLKQYRAKRKEFSHDQL